MKILNLFKLPTIVINGSKMFVIQSFIQDIDSIRVLTMQKWNQENVKLLGFSRTTFIKLELLKL